MTERLLAALKARANHSGLVLVMEDTLLRELSTDPYALKAELTRLENAGLIEILSPRPFLVITLRKWPGRGEDAPQTAPKAEVVKVRPYSFQSSLSQSKLLMKDSYRQPNE